MCRNQTKSVIQPARTGVVAPSSGQAIVTMFSYSSGPVGQDVNLQPPQEDRGGGGPGTPVPGAVLRPHG